MVVVENQFGPTDHTHLRQIMTCVALRDRKFVDSLLEEAGFEPSVPRERRSRWGARVSIADREDHRAVPLPSAAAAVNLYFHAMFAARGSC